MLLTHGVKEAAFKGTLQCLRTSVSPYESGAFFYGDSAVTRKYADIDARLLRWLKRAPKQVTTAKMLKALKVTDLVTQRHLSRRLHLLEEKGAIRCKLEGTTRVCVVVLQKIPSTLYKAPNPLAWHRSHQPTMSNTTVEPVKSIPASNSEEFIAAGGKVQIIPSQWSSRPYATKPGSVFDFSDDGD